MTLHMPPEGLHHATFAGLEPTDPSWAQDLDYWEEYNAAFFASNGQMYDPAQNSNVENWVSAPDRAPFSLMAEELLARVPASLDLTNVSTVFLAHWLPDVHLGTSVTNYVMHSLGLQDAFGLAFSDRGLTAPFFALDAMAKVLARRGGKGLLLSMDQRNILYRTPALDALPKSNSASLLVLDLSPGGRRYCGYARPGGAGDGDLSDLARRLGLSAEHSCFILPQTVPAGPGLTVIRQSPELLCAAPFAAMGSAPKDRPVVLVAEDKQGLAAVGFTPETPYAH